MKSVAVLSLGLAVAGFGFTELQEYPSKSEEVAMAEMRNFGFDPELASTNKVCKNFVKLGKVASLEHCAVRITNHTLCNFNKRFNFRPSNKRCNCALDSCQDENTGNSQGINIYEIPKFPEYVTDCDSVSIEDTSTDGKIHVHDVCAGGVVFSWSREANLPNIGFPRTAFRTARFKLLPYGGQPPYNFLIATAARNKLKVDSDGWVEFKDAPVGEAIRILDSNGESLMYNIAPNSLNGFQMWVDFDSEERPFEQAEEYCNSLGEGWRTPSDQSVIRMYDNFPRELGTVWSEWGDISQYDIAEEKDLPTVFWTSKTDATQDNEIYGTPVNLELGKYHEPWSQEANANSNSYGTMCKAPYTQKQDPFQHTPASLLVFRKEQEEREREREVREQER